MQRKYRSPKANYFRSDIFSRPHPSLLHMETRHEHTDLSPEEQQQRIAALERAFTDAEHRAQKHLHERNQLNDRNWDLQQENRRLEHDYESLRLQKGGFGFKTLLAVGTGSALIGLVLCYLFFRLKDHRAAAFSQFTREHQFRFEYALSHGQFDEVEAAIRASAERSEWQVIRPQVEFTKKIVEAAKRGCGK